MKLCWDIEKEIYGAGYKSVCGIDEAGRGPGMGPVFAAAVILPLDVDIPYLNDSKKLSEKKRKIVFDEIINCAKAFYIAKADVDEIEQTDILSATMLAMRRAYKGLPECDFALVDGNIARNFDIAKKTVIKGDATSPSIAAASILAKVSRDMLCLEIDKQYPQYNFKQNKGYLTKEHIEAIGKYGLCEYHRPSFCEKFV